MTLAQIRSALLWELDGDWVTPSELTRRLDLDHDDGWLRVALVLERLAVDGIAEIKRPGSRVRRFRLRPPRTTTSGESRQEGTRP